MTPARKMERDLEIKIHQLEVIAVTTEARRQGEALLDEINAEIRRSPPETLDEARDIVRKADEQLNPLVDDIRMANRRPHNRYRLDY